MKKLLLISFLICSSTETIFSMKQRDVFMHAMLKDAYRSIKNRALPELQQPITVREAYNDTLEANTTVDMSNFFIREIVHVSLTAKLNNQGDIISITPLEMISSPSLQPWVYKVIEVTPAVAIIGVALVLGNNYLA